MTLENNDEKRFRNQIIQNELSNIAELTIRIVNPDAPHIYFDYHNSQYRKNRDNDNYRMEYKSYEIFYNDLLKYDFNRKNAIEIVDGFAANKVVPRETFWYTYFSRQPLYLSRVRNHPILGEKIKAYYQLFVVKKIIDLLDSDDEYQVFLDCWGLLCYLAYLPIVKNEKENFPFILCGFRPKKYNNLEADNNEIKNLIESIPYSIGVKESGVKNLIITLRGIEPLKKTNEIENVKDQDFFDPLTLYSKIIIKVFKRFNDDFKSGKKLRKEEWISLTQIYAFYEFRSQKLYIRQIFKTLRELNITSLMIQTIEGTVLSNGEEMLIMTTFKPKFLPDLKKKIEDVEIYYKYLSSKISLEDLKGKYFKNTFQDNKYRYAIRFINVEDFDLEKYHKDPIPHIKEPILQTDVFGNTVDPTVFSEQIGIALNSAHLRFVRRAEYFRKSWENEKIFALDRELNKEISEQLSEEGHDSKNYNLRSIMYDRMINRAVRIAGGQKSYFLMINYEMGTPELASITDVYSSNFAFSSLEKGVKSLKFRSKCFKKTACIKCLNYPQDICLTNNMDDEPNRYCCLHDIIDKNIKSCMCVPILYNNRTLGIIKIDGYLPYLFNEDDKKKMYDFSNSIAPFIQHDYIINILTKLHKTALQTIEFNDKINKIIRIICQATLSDYASLWIWYENEKKLKLQSSIGYSLTDENEPGKVPFCKLGEGLCGKVAEKKKPIIVENIWNLDNNEIKYINQLMKFNVKSVFSYPITLPPDNNILGVVSIMSSDEIKYNEDSKNYLKILVDQISLFILKVIDEEAKLKRKIGHETQNLLLNLSSQTMRLEHLIKTNNRKKNSIIEYLSTIKTKYSTDDDFIKEIKRIENKLIHLSHVNINKVLEDILYQSDNAKDKIGKILKRYEFDYKEKNLLEFGKKYPTIEYSSKQSKLDLILLIKTRINMHREEMRKRDIKYDFKAIKKSNEGEEILSKLFVYINEENFDMIFTNLFYNAIKYSYKNREIKVKISIDDQDQFFTISIINYGIGIPKKYQKIIWEPGQRTVDFPFWPKSLLKPKGEGLGLNIAQEIAVLYQAEVYLKHSKYVKKSITYGIERETCFEVVFPIDITTKNIFRKK